MSNYNNRPPTGGESMEEMMMNNCINNNAGNDTNLLVDDHTILETLFFNEMNFIDTLHNNNDATESLSSSENNNIIVDQNYNYNHLHQQQQHHANGLGHNWSSSFDDIVENNNDVPSSTCNYSNSIQSDNTRSDTNINNGVMGLNNYPNDANIKLLSGEVNNPLDSSNHNNINDITFLQRQTADSNIEGNIPLLTTSYIPSSSSSSAVLDNGQNQYQQQQLLMQEANTNSSTSDATQNENQASELVSQFATLASKLGIHMPDSLLQSLKSVAALREQQQSNPPGLSTNKSSETMPAVTSEIEPSQVISNSLPAQNANQLQEHIAAASIAAAIQTQQHHQSNSSNDKAKSSNNAATNNDSNANKKRKRPRMEDCQAKLNRLRSENNLLKKYLANVTNKREHFEQERLKTENQMKEMVQLSYNGQNYSQEDIQKVLKKFSDMYADYGNCRKEELNFHLKQLEQLAIPTTITKMTLWTLGQQKKNAISNILMKELGITTSQAKKILEHRSHILKIQKNIQTTLDLVAKLKVTCEYKNQLFRDRMSKCQEILTPLQVMKLLIWVDGHSNMLEQVCPGWGSEMKIVGSKT